MSVTLSEGRTDFLKFPEHVPGEGAHRSRLDYDTSDPHSHRRFDTLLNGQTRIGAFLFGTWFSSIVFPTDVTFRTAPPAVVQTPFAASTAVHDVAEVTELPARYLPAPRACLQFAITARALKDG